MESKTSTGSGEYNIDLFKLLFDFLRHWWVFVICGVLVAGGMFLYTYFCVTPMYQASVSIFVNNRQNQGQSDYVSTADINSSRYLVSTYITIAKSDTVLEDVAERLGDRYTTGQLKGIVKATQLETTEFFVVSATTPDPVESATIANAMADVAPEAIANIIEGSSAKVLDYAKVPTSRSSPSYTRNTVIGLIIGLAIAAAILTIRNLSDVRVKDEEDIAALCEYPILGQIPDFDMLGSNKHSKSYAYAKPYANAESKVD